MKTITKIISFVLALFMLVSIVACGGAGDDTTKDSGNQDTSDAATESSAPEKVYDGVFQAGFGRIDITPEVPIPLNTGDMLTKVLDPLYATCVAVHDGDNTALLITLDVKNQPEEYCDTLRSRIKLATGVVGKNIMITATHNHSAPMVNNPSNDTRMTKWVAQLTNNVVKACVEAVEDLSDAEIHVGTGKTTGMAFVRRYLLADGTYTGIHNNNPSKASLVDYETKADDDVQIIRFVRADKKDVVMVNWQAHAAHAASTYEGAITGDYVKYIREEVEKGDSDTLCAFYLGACGNINLTAKVPGTAKYGNYMKVGTKLGEVIVEQFKSLTKVQAGKINTTRTGYKVNMRLVDAETVKKAQEVIDANYSNSLMLKYGFQHQKDVDRVITRSKYKDTTTLYIGAISFGDIGFASVPYEMFDTNGMEVKEGSPFKMTFMLTCTGGGIYVPSALAVPHGGYEVYSSAYEFGTAEKVVAELLSMLNKQFEKQMD